MTRIELMKKDVNTQNPLSGAVYGIYTDKKCENLLMTMSATGTDGKAVSDYFDSALKTVYVKEITAPTGYKLNTEVYKVAVTAGKTMTVTATDERVTGKVKIAKIDKETLAFKAQGDSVLRGAVYGLYAKEDIVHPDGTTGVLYKQDSLIAQGVIGDDGTLEFSELYLGEMYVKEITPPEGYTLDTTKYEVSVTYEGQDVAEVTRDLTVKEQVKKQAFQLIKISEDGEQTETDLVAYVRDDKDVLKLINNLIRNTTPKGAQSSDPFWEKSETALLQALMLYLLHEAPPEEQNFPMIMEMLGSAQVKEDDEDYQSPLDILFERLEMRDPESIAVKQYAIYKQAAGDICSK